MPHTTLPARLFRAETIWTELQRGTWGYADHITLGESRAVIKGLETALKREVAEAKLASLEDNRPTAGAMTKGRSPAPVLLYLTRRKSARTIATDTRLSLPWVETSKQPADRASRTLE